jgi:phospholipase/lecithinase/hemolysin
MVASNIFVFGDSLSDTGNLFKLTGDLFPPSPPYFNGRLSNGKVAVEYLDDRLGLDATLNPTDNFGSSGFTMLVYEA